ncbi:MAG: DUF2062 domain-containing protein [Gammaproteobacteria bacterium]|nr:DUF2062 domain-containing protein [Gammaproteobacteria bacterium]
MGLRRIFKRYLPERHELHNHKHLRLFGERLHDPNLWHLTRRSAAGGVAVGLFVAFVPIPLQMILAAAVAIVVRVNLPLAIVFVWVNNPITIPPLFYLAYRTGSAIMNIPIRTIEFEFSYQWFVETLAIIWQPFLLGCLVFGTLSAVAGYWLMRFLWRVFVVRKWANRRNSRAKT